MIVSASRRTDIPAWYSRWMLNRLREGFALVPNPYDAGRLGRVALSPENVDCLVFWTKNPAPMLEKLNEAERMGYRFYFQFTLTPYGPELEPRLPPKRELVRTFLELSRLLSPGRVVWRYDPVIVDARHPAAWHREQFRELCGALHGAACRCVFSYLDPYARLQGRFRAPDEGEMLTVAEGFAREAAKYGLPLFTCAEAVDLSRFGIGHSACIDGELVAKLAGCPIRAAKDPGQRPACGCIASVDIGAYDTCPGGCTYCYATTSAKRAAARTAAHDPASPLLTGWPKGSERITDRTSPSQKITQLSLF